ncbi:MAG: 4-phosphoerythronate dehydrogenase [Legionellaceae bacterium]|nr:4-phosphoerythronate dehydrogenase [Legionellaceae bacterium]
MSILLAYLTTQYLVKVNILADASLPHLDDLFQAPFTLTRYKNEQELHDALPSHTLLICRSTLKVTPELLKHSQLSCVATASSGIDHIDTDYLNQLNIPYLDAKGCNAEAVADYVLATLAYLKTQHKIPGIRAGVIGAGQVGSRVIQLLNTLGFDVHAYDPLKSNFKTCDFNALTRCDILCVHANLHDTQPHPTKNILDADFFKTLKTNTVIINAARGGIVDEKALLNTQKNIIYCTDVYQNEPNINPDIIDYATLCTPHIAGHSIEAKFNAVFYLSQKIHTHFNVHLPGLVTNTQPTQCLKLDKSTWEDTVLRLYHPLYETTKLKETSHKKNAFLMLRSQHQYRHNFNLCPSY